MISFTDTRVSQLCLHLTSREMRLASPYQTFEDGNFDATVRTLMLAVRRSHLDIIIQHARMMTALSGTHRASKSRLSNE